MRFISVSSSWLDSYFWDSGDLYIKYKSGVICHYEDVPFEMWQGLLNASSKGKYVWSSGLINWRYNTL